MADEQLTNDEIVAQDEALTPAPEGEVIEEEAIELSHIAEIAELQKIMHKLEGLPDQKDGIDLRPFKRAAKVGGASFKNQATALLKLAS